MPRLFGASGQRFNGTNRIVPSLQAPGFCNVKGSQIPINMSTAAAAGALALKVRSSTPDYAGYFVAFSGPNIPRTSKYGGASFKAGFKVSGTDWQEVTVPMKSFSYDWSVTSPDQPSATPGRPATIRSQHISTLLAYMTSVRGYCQVSAR